jgi:uncharacterized protein (DUF2147 family)
MAISSAIGATFTEVLRMRHHAFAAAMGVLSAALLAPATPSHAASAADPTGFWMKPDAERESKIQVFKCGKSKTQLCAKIAWLKDPNDSKGNPLHDIRNENASLRGRSIVGLTIFSGLTPSAPNVWTGQIYNPEDGHMYSATLTVLSRKQITLRGCKAWLLCGERQWLRTSAPQEVKPEVPAEGTRQIEASVAPAAPAALASAKPDAPSGIERVSNVSAEPAEAKTSTSAPAPKGEVQAMAEPEAPAPAESTEALPKAASLPVEEIAVPVEAPIEYSDRRGYGFLNVSTEADTPKRLSGETVPSMMVMAAPIEAEDAVEQAGTAHAMADSESVPLPAQKPKLNAKPKAMMASAPAVKHTPKPAIQASAGGQPLPSAADGQDDDDTAQSAQTTQSAEADTGVDDSHPLTRRELRRLRRQQQGSQPFLPWLR